MLRGKRGESMVVKGILSFVLLGLVFAICFIAATFVHAAINTVTHYRFETAVDLVALIVAGVASGWLGGLLLHRLMSPFPAKAVSAVFIAFCVLSAGGSVLNYRSPDCGNYAIALAVLYAVSAASVFYFLWPRRAAVHA